MAQNTPVMERLSPTTLNLRMKHFQWAEEKDVNLSKYVRDKIDADVKAEALGINTDELIKEAISKKENE